MNTKHNHHNGVLLRVPLVGKGNSRNLQDQILKLIVGASCFVAATLSQGAANEAVIDRDFWSYDAIEWGDGRPNQVPVVPKTPPYPQGFKAEYKILVPATGWYELVLTGGAPCLHDLLVDGQFIYRSAKVTEGKNGDSLEKDVAKVANLWLTGGAHTLCLQSVGRPAFPMRLYGSWQLRASEGRPEGALTAEKAGVDVVRAGETFQINLTGGGLGKPTSYELVRMDLLALGDAGSVPEVVATVDFPAGNKPVTKKVAIPCPAEGVFQLRARSEGKLLRPSEFRIGEYAVVDVKSVPTAGGALTLVHDIDCVAQTDNGKPVDPATFFECNGKTRITTSPLGKYRESNDGTGPDVEVPKSPTELPRSYSGFAYQLDVPDDNAAYLLEIDYPDDDRRSVTVPISLLSDKTGEKLPGDYSGKSWETGGMFPITKTMLKHRSVLWASSHGINVGLLSQQIGHRSAAARLRLYKFVTAQ